VPKATSALEKSLAILEKIAAERRPVTLTFLADATRMPKQTVHRVLQQLEDTGSVQRGVRRDSFVLGHRLRNLALSTLQAAAATLPIRAELERLAAEVEESVNLGILNGYSVRYLERVEYAWRLRFTINPNDELPAHAVAIGKLLLAYQPPRLRQDLLRKGRFERFTDWTLTDPAALEREFERIVADGYSLNNQEYHIGLLGAAVPVRNSTGEIIAGLAIQGVMPRTSLQSLASHLQRMRQAAARIAALLEDQTAAGAEAAEDSAAAAR
jgi:IclR family transcriptional regulator, acetate operon repressor